MRKEYSKELQRLFSKLIEENFPQFKPHKEKSMYYSAGERFYCWKPNESISFFIIYSPDERGHEAFTIEIGWSTNNRLPELSMRPSFQPTIERAEFSEKEAITRLPYFSGGTDFYLIEPAVTSFSIEDLIRQQTKRTPEEVINKITPILDNILKQLQKFGVPYLQEKARMEK